MPSNIKHDAFLEIATGSSRFAKKWKNTTIAWSAMLDKLEETHRTPETYGTYLKETPQRQAEIKDIGGFVGGFLAGGRRKSNTVVRRQLLTLDADFAAPDLWDSFTMLFDFAAAVYSTHKHNPESPRLRLLIPLDRPVMSDEYVAIARKVSDLIGIDQFDPAGFRPAQLMYWPSTSSDGEYLFNYQDGELLSADYILGLYTDWKDAAEWPLTAGEATAPVQAAKKQGDPLEKEGLIGAFCRTYSIPEAIETFLSDVYTITDAEDRYTYQHGTTSGGMVVYEDKFAYSHHGSDPASGQLCNAFDLVRIHRFGLRDENVAKSTPFNKLPSFSAMQDLAASDKEVCKLLTQERASAVEYEFADSSDFAEDAETANKESDEWMEKLDRDKKGNLKNTIDNAVLILRHDKKLKGSIGFNTFSQREAILKNLPWRKRRDGGYDFADADDSNLRHYMELCYGFTGKEKLRDALAIVVTENSFHPVKEYFKALPKWDKKNRIDSLFIDYMGADDTPYSRTVTRKMLVAAVARIFEPGVKFDNMVVLVGEQGIGKSTILDRLGVDWFTDSFSFHMLKGDSKRGEEQIQGAWIVEIGELAGIGKADLESAKSFIARREDKYRAAYGTRTTFYPRQCVFFGTTNNAEFLRDITGNRRFWPLPTNAEAIVKDVFSDLHPGEVAQIWAEALMYYKNGEALHLSADIAEVAVKMQESHTETDERVGMIRNYLETPLPASWPEYDRFKRMAYVQGNDDLAEQGTMPRMITCAAEIWMELFGGNMKDLNRQNTKFINDVLRSQKGWKATKSTRKFDFCGYQRAYERAYKYAKKDENGTPF